MGTIAKHWFRSFFFIVSIICLSSSEVFGATDDDIDAVFMTVALSSGQSESVMLSNNNEYVGPTFRPTAKTFTINSISYDTEDVKEIRFEMRQVDAIQDMEQSGEHVTDGIIYNINGQVVGIIDAGDTPHGTILPTLEGLPKGVYIVNGKKIIVR